MKLFIIIVIIVFGSFIIEYIVLNMKYLVLTKKEKNTINKQHNNYQDTYKQEQHIENTYEIEIYPYIKKNLLTQNEYYFYNRLREITEPLNLQILAKIRLADLIEVNKNQAGSNWMKYFAKIKAKHIDFAIADKMKIIALLELDDSSHNKIDRKERDSFVNNALLKAGYTVIRTNGNIDIVKKALIDKGYHENLYQNTIHNN